MKLGEIVEKMELSNRLVVLNAAGQVVYRGYVANFFKEKEEIIERNVKGYGIGLETYKKTENLWDWTNTEKLPESIPVKELSRYDIGELQQLFYNKVTLE